METIIRLLLQNFTLTFLGLGFLAAFLALLRKPHPWSLSVIIEAVFLCFIFFSIACGYFYNFVLHVFFGAMTAQFIGWADSPFQAEVGFASLGFGVVGLLAFRGSFDMRVAAVVGPACFLLGAAGTHIREMIVARNFAPGNAGVIFYTDILLPLIGLILLALQRKFAHKPA